jgi:uncharacterized surface protein with fasciclin (FAS1) repeats
MKRKSWLSLPLIAVLAAAGCAESTGPDVLVGVEGVAVTDVERRAAAAPAQRGAQNPTIVDVALAVNAQTGEFSTLIAAVLAADLAGPLSAVGQRTVFAPTDAAFAELGLNADNIGDLPQDALTNILLYHVTRGRRDAGSVVGSKRIRMANGVFTQITVSDAGAFIDDAQIVATDVEASNGIIHVIDAVLLP